jgi:hypothetical protein
MKSSGGVVIQPGANTNLASASRKALETGRIQSAENLLRGRKPQQKQVPPDIAAVGKHETYPRPLNPDSSWAIAWRRPVSRSISDSADPLAGEDAPQRERNVLASAWTGARQVLDCVIDLLDPPAAIAASGTVGYNTRQVMRDWLRNLEILIRRLLFITALGLVLPPPRRSDGRGARREPQPFAPGDPSTWKVGLRFFRTSSVARESVASQKSRDDQAEYAALPFALRLEALCRIIAKPEQRARSIARKLQRIRAANVGRNAPRGFAVRQWHIHRSRRTPAQDFITELMDGTESLAERWLARWQEPG